MNYQVEDYKSYDKPVPAGSFRFLLGLLMGLAGFYITVLSGIEGHGLGFFMMLASPFVIFKDGQ